VVQIDEISAVVIDECIKIHRELGPGLFEIVYETILAGRLETRGLKVARQVAVPLLFDGQSFEAALKVDILVEDRLVLEIKAVEQLSKVHAKQLLTYLRILKQPVGLLLNFSGET
jgi:GxxExxY protein